MHAADGLHMTDDPSHTVQDGLGVLVGMGVAMAVVMGNPQLMQFLMGEMFGHGAASFPENSLYYSRASAAAQVRLPPLDNLHLLHYNL